jgi:hypothetical protein
MALSENPEVPEFYVYHLEVGLIPFYVGVGRSARASDRVRYIRCLIKREGLGKPVKWSWSGAVIAGLLRSGREVSVAYTAFGLTRAAALRREKVEIGRLLKEGAPLCNIQHNPKRPRSVREFVKTLVARLDSEHP